MSSISVQVHQRLFSRTSRGASPHDAPRQAEQRPRILARLSGSDLVKHLAWICNQHPLVGSYFYRMPQAHEIPSVWNAERLAVENKRQIRRREGKLFWGRMVPFWQYYLMATAALYASGSISAPVAVLFAFILLVPSMAQSWGVNSAIELLGGMKWLHEMEHRQEILEAQQVRASSQHAFIFHFAVALLTLMEHRRIIDYLTRDPFDIPVKISAYDWQTFSFETLRPLEKECLAALEQCIEVSIREQNPGQRVLSVDHRAWMPKNMADINERLHEAVRQSRGMLRKVPSEFGTLALAR